MSPDDPIIEMQERMMYLEKQVADLNEVVTALHREVVEMRKQFRDIREASSPVDPDRTLEDDVPPHWGRR